MAEIPSTTLAPHVARAGCDERVFAVAAYDRSPNFNIIITYT